MFLVIFPVPNQPTLTATDSSNIEKTEHTNGDTVTLTCATVGADGYTFYKAQNDGSLNSVSSEKQTSNTYIIDPFEFSDSGTYTCKAYNGDIESTEESEELHLTLAGMSILF